MEPAGIKEMSTPSNYAKCKECETTARAKQQEQAYDKRINSRGVLTTKRATIYGSMWCENEDGGMNHSLRQTGEANGQAGRKPGSGLNRAWLVLSFVGSKAVRRLLPVGFALPRVAKWQSRTLPTPLIK